MNTENNLKEQNENLKKINYPKSEDIFNQETHTSIDPNGTLEENEDLNDNMEENLDVPGSELDNAQEEVGSEDEENNYYSTSDNNDNHEEINEDLIS
ncbi:hypothetical protein [Halpernia sp.]|uniref:hypothetical protein n=1 Tax=Halpernia sp. TaxID=2782209 RepID=UPI003A8D0742